LQADAEETHVHHTRSPVYNVATLQKIYQALSPLLTAVKK